MMVNTTHLKSPSPNRYYHWVTRKTTSPEPCPMMLVVAGQWHSAHHRGKWSWKARRPQSRVEISPEYHSPCSAPPAKHPCSGSTLSCSRARKRTRQHCTTPHKPAPLRRCF